MAIENVELEVTGSNTIHCTGCENRIETVLGRLPGVMEIKADHKTQKVQITLAQSRTSLDEIREKMEFMGYEIAS
ncbi:MAG: heavy-metal-associated domain-containing protein [Candidatus Bipolaricaulia bacterium]